MHHKFFYISQDETMNTMSFQDDLNVDSSNSTGLDLFYLDLFVLAICSVLATVIWWVHKELHLALELWVFALCLLFWLRLECGLWEVICRINMLHLLDKYVWLYICQWTGSKLVQVMACCLFGPKPLPESMLTLLTEPWGTNFSKIFQEIFSWKRHLKMLVSQNVGHLVDALMCPSFMLFANFPRKA